MRARDVMTPDVVTVAADALVGEAAELLVGHRISAVPVVDAEGALVGIVSESDFLPRVAGRPPAPWWLRLLTGTVEEARAFVKAHGRRVDEVMTRDVLTVRPETALGEVAHALEARGVKRAPVVADGRLVGIVSRADIVRALAAGEARALPPPSRADTDIREAVLAALADFDWSASTRLSVTVTDGVVSIYGVLSHAAQGDALKVAAENVPGVVRVELHARPWPALAAAGG
jgi:CBS domain-containing protein